MLERITMYHPYFIIDYDEVVVNRQLSQRGYSSAKNLYEGLTGAKAWLSVINDDYKEKDLGSLYLSAINNSDISFHDDLCYVSLGPGCGVDDEKIVCLLNNICFSRCSYIAIDVSIYLLFLSVMRMRRCTHMTVGYVSDFEERMDCISEYINLLNDGTKVYSLLGNTLGNLNVESVKYVKYVIGNLNKGDYLLLGLSVVLDGWLFEKDPRSKYDGYSDGDRRFILRSVFYPSKNPDSDSLSLFKEYVDISSEARCMGSVSIVLRNKHTKQVIIRIRRYFISDFVGLLKKEGLDVIYSTDVFDHGNVGEGIIMLKAH